MMIGLWTSRVGSATHVLKTRPSQFNAMLNQRKGHDLRRDDRDFRVGDRVLFYEHDDNSDLYTGRVLKAKIGYITSSSNPCALSDEALADGFCILTIQLKFYSRIVASLPVSRSNQPVALPSRGASSDGHRHEIVELGA
jgi:hypothetical protein